MPPPHNLDQLWTGHAHIRVYHPFRVAGEKNPAFNDDDARILDLKDGVAAAIETAAAEFADALTHLPLFPQPTILAIVPGSTAADSNANRPMALVAVAIAARAPFRLAAQPDTLKRHVTIEKLARGGARFEQIHLDSIRVADPQAALGSTVLLLDDVASTGNSILACRRLLQDAGAARVAALVLGQTE